MSSHDSIDIHHLAAAYALDALDERERAVFEEHYASCEVCAADVRRFRATAGRLAHASAAAPSPDVRARVLAEVAATRQLPPLVDGGVRSLGSRRRQVLGAGLGIAAAFLLLLAGVVVLRDGGGGMGEELAAVVEAPDGRMVTLTGTGDVAGSVMVAWSAERDRVLLMADGLPPAPDGQAYELWLIGEAGPMPMNVLDPASGGVVHHMLDLPDRPTAWGVTLEPAAGSPVPTGEILYQASA